MIEGIYTVLEPMNLMLVFFGTVIGIIFGAIPGLTATMGVALALPLTFSMEPASSLALLSAIYIGGISGGLISAILLNIPGTPASIATTFDGIPMTKNGQAGKALAGGVIFSFLGGLVSFIALMFIAPPLADFALQFGPFEYFSISIFSMTMVAGLSDKSLPRGVVSALFGIAFATVGVAPIDAFPRFTFGMDSLSAGFGLLPMLVGLYCLPELLVATEGKLGEAKLNVDKVSFKGMLISFKEFREEFVNFLRSSILGLGIGILPGIGGGTANIIAYVTSKKYSKHPELYGKGTLSGIVASESSNNASVGGALIPLLTLGIPGDTVTAMLIGAFMIHGISPGPMLFMANADLVSTIFAALNLSNIIMLIVMIAAMPILTKILLIPRYVLLPIIVGMCFVGAFALNGRIFDVGTMLFFGCVGYFFQKFNFPLPPIVLGFVLGPLCEQNLRRGLSFSDGSYMPFLTEPISGTFIALTIVSIVFSVLKSRKKQIKE